jgi:hypothetical protein
VSTLEHMLERVEAGRGSAAATNRVS